MYVSSVRQHRAMASHTGTYGLSILCFLTLISAQHITAQTTDDHWLHTQAHMDSACYAVWLTPQHSTALARLASQIPEIAPNKLMLLSVNFRQYHFHFHCRFTAVTQLNSRSLLQSQDHMCISCSSFKQHFAHTMKLPLFISG